MLLLSCYQNNARSTHCLADPVEMRPLACQIKHPLPRVDDVSHFVSLHTPQESATQPDKQATRGAAGCEGDNSTVGVPL